MWLDILLYEIEKRFRILNTNTPLLHCNSKMSLRLDWNDVKKMKDMTAKLLAMSESKKQKYSIFITIEMP